MSSATPPHDPFLPEFEEILRLLRLINEMSHERAHHFAIEPPVVSEMESEIGMIHRFSLGQGLDGLMRLKRDHEIRITMGPDGSRVSNSGRLQEPIDRHLYLYRKALVRKLLGDVVSGHSGEEGTKWDWRNLLSVPAGKYVVLDDPADGTVNLLVMREGWSLNFVLLLALGDGKFAVKAVVVTTSNGDTMIWNTTTGEATTTTRYGRVVSQVLLNGHGIVQGTVALVGTRGETREVFKHLLDPHASWGLPPEQHGTERDYDPPLMVWTTGGAPVMSQWHSSQLAYLVVPSSQTVWDGCALAAAMSRGATYYIAETKEPASLSDVTEWLSTVTSPSGSNPKPVKAGVLVRDGALPEVTKRILDVVHAAVVKKS